MLIAVLSAACGGEDEEAPIPRAENPETPSSVSPPADDEGGVPVGRGQAETTGDVPFELNTQQPVPPGFREAYGRRALISVQFYKLGGGSFDPEGLSVDRKVSDSMESLCREYPTVECLRYDISNPGSTEGGDKLREGEYGTLPAQLGVGITPFVAMLAPSPSGDGYVITNLFQGYVPEPVLSQALYDLSSVEVEDNTSDIGVTLGRVVLTDRGGGIEFFTVKNRTDRSVNLQGYTLKVLDPETNEVDPGAAGITINGDVRIEPGETAAIGRVPDVVDAAGDRVDGTFEGGQAMDLAPGDQVALLDPGGAVADTLVV